VGSAITASLKPDFSPADIGNGVAPGSSAHRGLLESMAYFEQALALHDFHPSTGGPRPMTTSGQMPYWGAAGRWCAAVDHRSPITPSSCRGRSGRSWAVRKFRAPTGERPPECRARQTPRHPVMSWCRGAPAACAARERHVTVARNDDRVRNLAGLEGLAARPLRWSVTQASGQQYDHSPQARSGEWSPEHRPRRRDGPQRRGRTREARYCPHRSPAWRPRSTPAVKCATGRVRKVVGALFAQCGRRLAVAIRVGQACQVSVGVLIVSAPGAGQSDWSERGGTSPQWPVSARLPWCTPGVGA
jgi:hypothetical protein